MTAYPIARRFLAPVLFAACLAPFALPLAAQEGMDASTGRPERPSFTAWSKGRDAERAGNLDAALAAYSEALRDEPGNHEYRDDVERLRFLVSDSYANQAERAVLAGNPAEAAILLRRSLHFDTQNEQARDRLRQLARHAIRESTSVPEFATAAPTLAPQPGTRDFNIRGTARTAWLDLARQFGLLAVFDEDVTEAQIRFRVSGLDFHTASLLLAQQTGTFIRPLDAHTFLVVNDTQQKRREYLPQIERTILLPESDTPEAMNEMARTVRDITEIVHTQLDTRSRSLTVRGSQDDVALATALVRQLEQPRSEVMLEIDVLEVDRSTAANLGIVPPSSSQVVTLSQQQLQLAQQSTNGLVQVIEELFGTPASLAGSSTGQISALLGTGSTSLSSLVPPLVAFGGGQTIFLATLPGATANFASQLSAVHSAQRVLLRAEDGEPASFFVGERYPINFATLSNEFTTSGSVPGIVETTLSQGASPRGVTTAVLRSSSSFIDIITANHDAGTVSVSLGNGDGSFQSHVDYPANPATGSNLVAVASATFRAAGQPPDLAAVDQGTNNVQIFFGNGDGTFQNPVPYPVGTQPSGLVLGDFNSDGIVDIAVTNTGDNSVSLLFGNGDGTFQAAQTIPLTNGQGPVGITSADFNGDGHPDLAVANSLSNSATILSTDPVTSLSRFKNTVTATLNSPLTVPNGVINVVGATDASFDGTFTGVTGSGTATLHWSQPGADVPSGVTGLAVAQSDLTAGTRPVAVAAATFDSSFQCPGNSAQAHPDLAVANQTDGTVTVFLNQCNGTFPSTTISVGNQPDALIAGDFNNDSAQDLVVADSGDGGITVLFGAGTGAFPDSIPLQTSADISCNDLPAPSVPCQGLASGDFNGDGLLDVVVTDPDNNTTTVVLNSNQIAAGNEQLPYPGFQYEDLGIKAKATPHIHPSGDVTLTLNLEIRSLSAASFNGIPVLTNRTVEQTMRLRPNEPSVLSGIFSNQQTLMVTGTPGAEDIPGVQNLLTNRNPQEQQTELVVVLTPRLVRLAPRVQQVFYAGHEREAGTFPPHGFEGEERPRPFRPFVPPGQPPQAEQPPDRPQP